MSHRSLHLYLDAYLSVREALGFQMRAERTLLRDFVGFVELHGDGGPIRAQLAVDWACASSTQRGRGGTAPRLSMARRFLTSLRATRPETDIPPSGLGASFRRPQPYLFTPLQITAFLRAAHAMGPQGSLRPSPFATIIGLLASTGRRVGEAIRLTVQDVHLDAAPPRLHIREPKLHQSRWVPRHPTTVVALRHYRAMRSALGYAAFSDIFLVSAHGGPLTYRPLRRGFLALGHTVGLGPTASGRRPSVRALRHSFAVQRLQGWYQEGRDGQGVLPHLSVSLGHVRPQDSDW
jgi:integrase